MSSLFLLPVSRDAHPPIDIWKRGAEAELIVNQLGDSRPLVSSFLVTDSENWKVKHLSLYHNVLVFRSLEHKWSKDGPIKVPGAVIGACRFMYNKLQYSEVPLGMISKIAWPHLVNPARDDKSLSSNGSNRVRYIKYLQIFDNPFEEISETIYFERDEEMELWRILISGMCVLNINFKTKYVVQNKIGSGAYSKVYLIKELVSNSSFAAKAVLLEKFSDFEKAREVIESEVDALHRLSGCGIAPKLHEVHQVEDIVYLVMEYIEGLTLNSYVKRLYSKQKMTDVAVHSIME
jgi:hypothetical protein